MKICGVCGLSKPLEAFPEQRDGAGGRHWRCRPCSSAHALAWKAANKGRAAQTLRLWRERNKDRLRDARNRWFANRPGYRAQQRVARQRAQSRRPGWADLGAIRRYYRLARTLRELGLDVHVGHWVPLRNRHACGLHVEHNLCLELARDNLHKGARVLPEGEPPAISRARALKFCVARRGST